MKSPLVKTIEIEDKTYSLLLNMEVGDPCGKCVFAEECDSNFTDSKLDGYAPYLACDSEEDTDCYFVLQGDEDK